jgi:transcriptional/translational regulatory protein YebC/TACO1
MADVGSVSWQFKRISFFSFPLGDNDPDQIFELAVEAGADDVSFDNSEVEITGSVEVFKEISNQLKKAKIKPEEAGLQFAANNEIELPVEETVSVLRTIEALEELDDVQTVYSALSISEEAMAQYV